MSGFDSNLPVDHQAVRALGSRNDAEALKALGAAASVNDQFLRRTAVEVIGRHPLGRELQACILTALDDPSEYVVRTACDIVERWRLSEARELILPLLANASGETRQHAIRALGAIWGEQDFQLIFGIYTGDRAVDVRREAAWMLRRKATAANWRMLFDAFRIDEPARHRQWACKLAESFSGPEILPVLSPLLSDVDGHVRTAAARSTDVISGRSNG